MAPSTRSAPPHSFQRRGNAVDRVAVINRLGKYGTASGAHRTLLKSKRPPCGPMSLPRLLRLPRLPRWCSRCGRCVFQPRMAEFHSVHKLRWCRADRCGLPVGGWPGVQFPAHPSIPDREIWERVAAGDGSNQNECGYNTELIETSITLRGNRHRFYCNHAAAWYLPPHPPPHPVL